MSLQAVLRSAVGEGRVLRIAYRRFDREFTRRDIEVYSFDSKYIDAYCRLRQDPRVFRIDRIREAGLLPERFDPDPVISKILGCQGWSNRSEEWLEDRKDLLKRDLAWDRELVALHLS